MSEVATSSSSSGDPRRTPGSTMAAVLSALTRHAPLIAASTIALLGLVAPDAAAQDQVPNPLTLSEAIQQARERSPRLARSRAALDVARADRVDAALRPNPAITVESSNYPLFSSPRPAFWNGQEFLFRIDQEFETQGRRRLRTDAAASGIDAAEAALADAQRLLDLDVRRAYFEVVRAVADLEASRRSLSEIDQLIALNRARLDQGEISGVEVRRLQVERLRFSDDTSAAELAVRRARSGLLALIGYQNLGQPFDVTDALTMPTVAQPGAAASQSRDVLALQIRALELRHDVRAVRAEESRAETLTRLQRALRTPNITAGGGYARDVGTSAVTFGITVPLPLTNRNQGGIARAAAERQVAASERALVETAVRLEVQQAADAVEVARFRATAIERDYLPNARQALDTVVASYRVGAANLIDLLDAQRAFRDTQRTYNRALFDWQISLAELGAAVGEPSGIR